MVALGSLIKNAMMKTRNAVAVKKEDLRERLRLLERVSLRNEGNIRVGKKDKKKGSLFYLSFLILSLMTSMRRSVSFSRLFSVFWMVCFIVFSTILHTSSIWLTHRVFFSCRVGMKMVSISKPALLRPGLNSQVIKKLANLVTKRCS